MHRYIIERELPGAGRMNDEQMHEASRKSCDVLQKLGHDIQWIESYVADDRIYCVYDATDESLIQKHAKESGFPAKRISRVRNIMTPMMAEA